MILIERQPYTEHDISFSLTTSGRRLCIIKAFQVTFFLLKNVAFIGFFREFGKSGEDYHCKLIFSSRKAPEMEAPIKVQEVMLKPVSIVDAMVCAQDVLASHDVSLDQGKETSQYLEELLLFHENNFLFLNTFLPTLKDESNKLEVFRFTSHIGLLASVSESLDLNLASTMEFTTGPSDDQPTVNITKPNIISSFTFWMMELQENI